MMVTPDMTLEEFIAAGGDPDDRSPRPASAVTAALARCGRRTPPLSTIPIPRPDPTSGAAPCTRDVGRPVRRTRTRRRTVTDHHNGDTEPQREWPPTSWPDGSPITAEQRLAIDEAKARIQIEDL